MKKRNYILFSVVLLVVFLYFLSNVKFNKKEYIVNSYVNNKEVNCKYNEVKEEYIGVIEIKKIKLKKGFYKINSSLNDVNKNIMVINSSDMPNVKNGNLILASHSGNSSVSYFKNLDKLEIGDVANITYLNKRYDYKLVNYYDVDKTGKVRIIKNNDINNLTLITCKKNTDKQTVYIFEIIKKEEKNDERK